MAVQAKEQLAGRFILGSFQGVSQDEFPKLHIGTFAKDDGTLFEERLDFAPFNPRTGSATLPEGLELGMRVAVQISVNVRGYRDKDTGEARTFVALKALGVTPI